MAQTTYVAEMKIGGCGEPECRQPYSDNHVSLAYQHIIFCVNDQVLFLGWGAGERCPFPCPSRESCAM